MTKPLRTRRPRRHCCWKNGNKSNQLFLQFNELPSVTYPLHTKIDRTDMHGVPCHLKHDGLAPYASPERSDITGESPRRPLRSNHDPTHISSLSLPGSLSVVREFALHPGRYSIDGGVPGMIDSLQRRHRMSPIGEPSYGSVECLASPQLNCAHSVKGNYFNTHVM